jgi:hypothetical protein
MKFVFKILSTLQNHGWATCTTDESWFDSVHEQDIVSYMVVALYLGMDGLGLKLNPALHLVLKSRM